jgi:hypothetical protein
VEGRGDAAVRLPDLLGQAVELGEVLLAVVISCRHRGVDDGQPPEIGGRDVTAFEVELLDGGEDADRRLRPGRLAVLQL